MSQQALAIIGICIALSAVIALFVKERQYTAQLDGYGSKPLNKKFVAFLSFAAIVLVGIVVWVLAVQGTHAK